MITFYPVTELGQISEGETLIIEKKNGVKFMATAKKVLNKESAEEEVILSVKKNDYFIVSMMLDGSSWVKNVVRLPGVQITTLTNTTRGFVRH